MILATEDRKLRQPDSPNLVRQGPPQSLQMGRRHNLASGSASRLCFAGGEVMRIGTSEPNAALDSKDYQSLLL